ncbi:MAG: glutathione synthase, partial [Cytophagales bacterium]|nr:glutathione synthase [Cytophagales bacterium]
KFTSNGAQSVIAQEYLPAALEGDKRIILVDGEPIGAILWVHGAESELNNREAGGTPHPSKISTSELNICASLKPVLTAEGIFFCGVDIIGGKLIDINVLSPTGLQEMSQFDRKPYHHLVIDKLEAFASKRKDILVTRSRPL